MILKAREDFMVFEQPKFIAKWLTVVSYSRSNVVIDHCRGKGGRFVTVLWTRDFLARPILPGNRSLFMKKKRKSNIFENCTCQQVNMAKNSALQISNTHFDRSRCWQHLQEATKKTVSFTVSWQKQIKLCVYSQKGELFNLSTFPFQSLMLKLTKKLKLWFAMFENTVKIQLLCICCLRLHVHACIHPWIKLLVFFVVSSLTLLRSLRVYILKQLFTSGSVSIVE